MTRLGIRHFVAIAVLLFVVQSSAAQPDRARHEFESGAAARTHGDYTTAAASFGRAVELDPRTDYRLAYAEVLGWLKRFAEAGKQYRTVLQHEPASRAARVGLAQILLWEQRYDDAADEYRRLLRDRPNDVDAHAGLATAAYWSGDLRSAQREYAVVLLARPGDKAARAALDAIAASTASRYAVGMDAMSDDQPMDRTLAYASYSMFTDPLTRWTAGAGTLLLSSDEASGNAPFAELSASTAWPEARLRAGGSLRLLRFPDGKTQPLGRVAFARTSGPAALELSLERSELLYTTTSIDNHPSATTASLRWTRERGAHSSAAAIHSTRYFDDNSGISADAYHLVRVIERNGNAVSVGVSVSYRDTEETRFVLAGATSTRRQDGTYRYSYDARYDPYWTPEELVDARAIVAATLRTGRATVHLHADGGIGRDRDLVFGPESGITPFAPAYPVALSVSRTFHPWRAFAGVSIPLASRLELTAGLEHQTTAFYNANTFRAGVTGRF